MTREGHHNHQEEHPVPGARSDVSHHPQAHMSQWHSPVRQTTHTSNPRRGLEHPDRSYTAT